MKARLFEFGLFFIVLFCGLTLVSCDEKEDEEKEVIVIDKRIENVLPEDIRISVEKYMPLFLGVNPPNIEGTYYIDPYVTVYCEDEGGYEPGRVISSYYINFSNQNMRNNTIDMYKLSSDFTDKSDGKGVFISGSDDKFTAYFSATSINSFSDYNVYTKTSVVISGKKTKNGIKDLYYAFVMLEKSDDPENYIMEEGYFRIFKDDDGLSEYSSLPDDINQLPRKARLVKEGNIKSLSMSANTKKYKQ